MSRTDDATLILGTMKKTTRQVGRRRVLPVVAWSQKNCVEVRWGGEILGRVPGRKGAIVLVRRVARQRGLEFREMKAPAE